MFTPRTEEPPDEPRALAGRRRSRVLPLVVEAQ
jgi:hypothetical protein